MFPQNNDYFLQKKQEPNWPRHPSEQQFILIFQLFNMKGPLTYYNNCKTSYISSFDNIKKPTKILKDHLNLLLKQHFLSFMMHKLTNFIIFGNISMLNIVRCFLLVHLDKMIFIFFKVIVNDRTMHNKNCIMIDVYFFKFQQLKKYFQKIHILSQKVSVPPN